MALCLFLRQRWFHANHEGNMRFLSFVSLLSFVGVSLYATPCHAEKDVRLALLVANQQGWKKDPKLNYVISGDLQPMAKTLRQLGFSLFSVLANKDPKTLRKSLRALQARLMQKPRVTTFFFYYSGHADKHYFHMGSKGRRPFSYKELVQLFARIPVRRRFAVIDACFSGEIIRQFGSLSQFRSLRSQGHLKAKGVEPSLVLSDLRRYLPDQGSQAHGLQLLGSSRHLSFESSKRKGSVFTYHFLRGLRGAADLDKDGKIAMNELFLYTKPRVRKETGQSPQQWLFREGGETYGFAPAYRSMLQIPSAIQGRLQVSVGGFVWRWHKRKRNVLRLAVGAGKGEIQLQQRRRCFQGSMQFPANGRVVLSTRRLFQVPCATALRSKSGIQLPAKIAFPLSPTRTWNLDVQSGARLSSGVHRQGGDLAGGGSVGLRHGIFGLSLSINGTSVSFSSQAFAQLLLEMRGEVGFRHLWGSLDLFAGGFASLGLLLQDVNQSPTPSFLPQLGLTSAAALWFHENVAVSLSLDASLLPTIFLNSPRLFFSGGVRLGLRFKL